VTSATRPRRSGATETPLPSASLSESGMVRCRKGYATGKTAHTGPHWAAGVPSERYAAGIGLCLPGELDHATGPVATTDDDNPKGQTGPRPDSVKAECQYCGRWKGLRRMATCLRCGSGPLGTFVSRAPRGREAERRTPSGTVDPRGCQMGWRPNAWRHGTRGRHPDSFRQCTAALHVPTTCWRRRQARTQQVVLCLLHQAVTEAPPSPQELPARAAA
jgi:hypothetical protein